MQVHVGNDVVILLFGRQPNRGHSDQITRIVDVESPQLIGLLPLGVQHIGTEYLGYLVFEGKGEKRYKRSRVDIYASKIFFIQNKVILKEPPPHF